MGRRREFDEEAALAAALSVFWQKGYEGASFDDLSRTTGVARPGLYAAFGNKAQLFVRALDLYEKTYLGFMREALDEPTSLDVVSMILHGSARAQTLSDDHLGCLGVNGALACSTDAEDIRLELVRRRSANELALRERLERARAEGDLPPDQDCAALAGYVMTVAQGMAVQAKSGVSREALGRIAAHALLSWPSGSGHRSRKAKQRA